MVNGSTEVDGVIVVLTYFLKTYCFGCDQGPNIIASTISLALALTFTRTFIYTDAITIASIVHILLLIILYFGLVTSIGMILTYIIQ